MQNQYPKKIHKLLTQSQYIIPTYMSIFYSILKLVCSNISNDEITPEILDILSKIYGYCKKMLERKISQDGEADSNQKGQQGGRAEEGGYLRCLQKLQFDNQAFDNKTSSKLCNQHRNLITLLDPLLKYLPKSELADLIYKNFLDESFFETIEKQILNSYQIITSKLNESGNLTPVFGRSPSFSKQERQLSNKQTRYQQSLTCLRCINRKQHKVINEMIKKKYFNGNKIHINGNNQLSLVFWFNCFKLDYAVHFDVFWSQFINYLHKKLNGNSAYFLKVFPEEVIYQKSSIKEKIHQVVDQNNKYYITSANVNDLFWELSQPKILQLLIQLTINQKYVIHEQKSTKCLTLRYNWKDSNQTHPRIQQKDEIMLSEMGNSWSSVKTNLKTDYNTKKIVNGTVSLNNFQYQKKQNQQILKSITNSLQLPPQSQIIVTGSSIGYNTKIFENKYPPTIRFGSLTDNQICIKNKYVSRKQFMIIQQFEAVKSEDKDGKYNEKDSKGWLKDKSIYNSFKESNKISYQSKYYLVCLSPSNHTSVIYQEDIEVHTGLIFKFEGIHIQIVQVIEQFNGISNNNQNHRQKQDEDKLKITEENKCYNQSKINLSDLSDLSQSIQYKVNVSKNGQFRLLTSMPQDQTQKNEVLSQSVEQQQYQKTLLQLPTRKSSLIIKCQLQCMYISGESKNKKFRINSNANEIQVKDRIFRFIIEEKGKIKGFGSNNDRQPQTRFLIPRNTQILAKTANQVLTGHLSDKILLKGGMVISLQDVFLQVLE